MINIDSAAVKQSRHLLHLRRLARTVRWLSVAGVVLGLGGFLLLLAFGVQTRESGWLTLRLTSSLADPTTGLLPGRIEIAIDGLPTLLACLALYSLAGAMRLAEEGRFFSRPFSVRMQAMALASIVAQLTQVLSPLLQALARHLDPGAGAGDLPIRLDMGSSDAWSLLLALVVLVLARILRRAVALAEDQSLIV